MQRSTPVTAAKFCKDCRWQESHWLSGKECHHPTIGPRPLGIDPVTGKTNGGGFWPCDVNRMFSDENCGRYGKLWEKRT